MKKGHYRCLISRLRTHVLSREPDDLRKELGTGATDVACIVSEIREKLKVKPRQKANPGAEAMSLKRVSSKEIEEKLQSN